jgi:hypothetical protein
MTASKALIQVEEIAASYANSKGEYGKSQTYRYLQIILEGFADLNIFTTSEVGKVNWYAGTVGTDGCIELPSDCIDYVRIGTPINGVIQTLTRNDNLDMPIGLECGQVTGVTVTQYLLGEPIYWNWTTVDYAATGGKNFAYYRFDKPNRRIVFNGDCVNRPIVIEYISTGISLSGETWIPREMMQLLKLYLNWQLKLYSDDKNVEYAAREFAIERQRLMNFQWSLRADEFLDLIRSNMTRAIKR